jgi:hypothetical protein
LCQGPGKSYIVGVYKHSTRMAADKTLLQLHAECAKGAIEDAESDLLSGCINRHLPKSSALPKIQV